MKNFKILTLFMAMAVMFTFVQCDSDDGGTSGKLPENAEMFLKDNYPNATYEVHKRKGPSGSEETLVVLNNGAHINFTQTGDVVYVGGAISKVPDTVIIEKIRQYVTENYPTVSIVEWELDDDEQEVELSNNIELVFDLEGNFLYSENDADDDGVEEQLTVADLPDNIKTFVDTHFPEVAYKEIIKETQGERVKFEIEMSNDVEMDFNAMGELTGIEADTGIPMAIVPEKISNYVSENHPETKIVEWELDRRKQEVELSNDVELVFDLDGNFLYKD